MLRTILVGLDGTAFSDSAVELGIRWARRYDGLLVGLGIIDEPAIRRPQAVPAGASQFKRDADDAHVADARRRVEQFLDRFVNRCAEAQISAKELEDVGTPWERIVLEAQRYDLIMLGKETHFRFETQSEPCDTLDKVLHHAPRPVVVVPEKIEEGQAVVIGFDGSLQAARAVKAFASMGPVDLGPVHVVTIGSDKVELAQIANRAVEFLGSHDIQAKSHVIQSRKNTSDVLLETSVALDAALVVLGAYGKPLLKEFFLGSVTRKIVHDTTVPLFLYH